MPTRQETLIDALITNIKAESGVDASKVFRLRIGALNDTEMPAYIVHLGPDVPQSELGNENIAFLDLDVLIYVDMQLRQVSGNIDSVFLDMRAKVHRALMADVTQGLSFCYHTIYAGSEEPALDDESERNSIVYRTNWVFKIRTSVTDIEA